MKKNNIRIGFRQQNNCFKKYTLKKLSVGVVSVGIGIGFVVPNEPIIVEAAAVETIEEEEQSKEVAHEKPEELEITAEIEETSEESELEETAAETPEGENEEATQESLEGEGELEETLLEGPVEEIGAEEASVEGSEEEVLDSEQLTAELLEEELEAEEATTEAFEESEEALQESLEDEAELEETAEYTMRAAIEESTSEERAPEIAEEDQTLAEPNDVAKGHTQIIEADAIANGYIKSGTDASNAVSTLSGGAWVVDRGTPSTMANGLTAVPTGTKVFLRWVDRDGAVSPIYSTVTHHHVDVNDDGDASGSFAFDLRQPWVDANGKEHIYRAISGQYYKLWIQDYETEEGNTVTMFRQVGGLFPGSFVNSVSYSNLGQFPLIGTNLQRTGIFMYIKPTKGYMTKPEEEHVEGASTGGLTGTGSVAGRVWLETGAGDYANSATGPNYNIADTPAENYTVVFSSLTPEGAAAYKDIVERLDTSEQVNATKHLLEKHPEYIAATVYTVTDEEGRYQLTFPEGTYNHHYLYGYVSDPSGKVVNSYSSYTSPLFRSPNANLSFAPQAAPSPLVKAWFNVNFAVMPDTQVTLDIINYDSTANPASIGDTALLKINGNQLSPLNNRIVWTNSKGDVLLTYDHLTTIAEAEKSVFTVPEGTPDGEIFQATLYAEENAIASDSFIVHVPGEKSLEASNYEAHYEDIKVKQGEEGIVKSPTFIDSNGESVQLSEGTRFRSGNFVPEWALINPDGSITVRPGEEVEEATYRIPVVVNYADGSSETAFAKVSVTSPLSEKYLPKAEIIDKNYGEPTTKEEVIDAVTIPDYPVDEEQPTLTIPEGTELPDGTASGEYKIPVEVTYPDGSTDEATVTVVVGNQPSSAIYVPEAGWIEKDYGAPTSEEEIINAITIPGYSADKEQPVLTIVEGTDLPDGTKAGEYEIPVEITYPDGSTDEVTVTVHVKEQPLSDIYTPEAEIIEKSYGESTTEEDVLNAITILDYPEDKEQPTFTVTAYLPDGTKPGEYKIPVEVTYPDGSIDEVSVTVVVKEQPLSELYTPTAEIIEKNYGEPTTEAEIIAGVSIPGYSTEGEQPNFIIPEGTRLPDGMEAGEYKIPVEVTYPDGSTDEATVTVVVGNQPSSAIYVPEAELIEKDYGEPTSKEEIMDVITIPGYSTDEKQPVLTILEGTDLPDGTEAGEYKIPVEVTYPDGSTDKVIVAVHVKEQPLSDIYTPKTEFIKKAYGEPTVGEEVLNAVTIPDYPEDERQPALTITTGLPDGTEAGTYEVPVKVVYPDGSVDEVIVTVVVDDQPYSDIYTPKTEQIEKDYGESTTEEEILDAVTIPDYPEGEDQPTFMVTTDLPDGTEAGEYEIPVEMIYPDGSTDEVTVTVVVGDQPLSDIYTPKTEFIKKAYGEPTVGEEVLNAVTIPDYPEDERQPALTITTGLPDGTEAGTYEVPVKVVYPDGSVDEVIVTVVVDDQPYSDIYTPKTEQIEKDYGESTTQEEVTSAVTIPGYSSDEDQPVLTIPEGTDLPDGTTAGEYKIPVEVTYPDGSVDEVTVTVVVGDQPYSEVYTPEAENIEKNYGESTTEAEILDAIAVPGYLEGEDQPTFTVITDLPDGTEAGTYEVPVKVSYPDGSVDEVTVIVVIGAQPYSDIYTPEVGNIEKDYGESTTKEEVTNAVTIPGYSSDEDQPVLTIPEGTRLPDGTEAGTYEIPVEVIYPDGSVDEVTVTVVVGDQPYSEVYTPETEQIEKKYGETTTEAEIIAGVNIPDYPAEGEQPNFIIPEGTRLPDGTEAGTYEIPVEVIYPDGSTGEVTVTVVVGDQPYSEVYTPETEQIEKKYGESTTKEEVTNAVTIPGYSSDEDQPVLTIPEGIDLPDGTTAGEYEIPVEVTYPDGSVDEVTVTVVVGDQPFSDIYTPEVGNIEKDYGEPTTQEDIIETITILDYPEEEERPTFTVITDLPDGTEPGEYIVSVKVTYPDNSSDEIKVTIVVGEPLTSDHSVAKPKTEPIEKSEGEPITEEEIIEAVTSPDYSVTSEQPVLTIPTELPDNTVAGEYEIPVEITYSNGSTDETTVTVRVKKQDSANTDKTDNVEEDVEKTISMLPKTGVTTSLFSALTGLFMLGIGGGMLIKNNKNKRK